MAAALVFACDNPTHHDGDAIRCAGQPGSMRLDSIDAPEMPGACRPGRQCTPGDPYAARDYLSSLTAGRRVECEDRGTDYYGRTLVRCTADGLDLGCAMVAGGHAVERYGSLNCSSSTASSSVPAEDRGDQSVATYEEVPTPEGYQAKSDPQPSLALPRPGTAPRVPRPDVPVASAAATTRERLAIGVAALLLVNGLTWIAFLIDKNIAAQNGRPWARRQRRVPEAVLLGLAAAGGSPGALFARHHLRHKTLKQPFSNILIMIGGLQIGGLMGLWLFWSELF
jgi:uncharacterized membrane protein YsdA (DUF1294 family)